MSDRPASDTLPAALPREMVRVAGLIAAYQQVENGRFAAMMMQASIDRAQKAIEDWDAAAMLWALNDLRGYTL